MPPVAEKKMPNFLDDDDEDEEDFIPKTKPMLQ